MAGPHAAGPSWDFWFLNNLKIPIKPTDEKKFYQQWIVPAMAKWVKNPTSVALVNVEEWV